MAPPSAGTPPLAGLPSLLFSPPVHRVPRTNPLLPPRGNRGEARRTFRLITVLQFNEKPVSVLSVHNGRRFDEAYTAGFDRDAPWIPRRCTPAAAGLARANLLTCCWPPLFDANAASAPFFSGVETWMRDGMGWGRRRMELWRFFGSRRFWFFWIYLLGGKWRRS